MKKFDKIYKTLGMATIAMMLGLVLSLGLAGLQAQAQVLMTQNSESGDISSDQLEEEALAGDREAQYELGEMYIEGVDGVDRDVAKGMDLLIQSASHGYDIAEYRLCAIYGKGEGAEVPQDSEAAIYWCYRAAALRNYKVAQHGLGLLYTRGKGAFRGTDWARNTTIISREGVLEDLGLLDIFEKKEIDKNHKMAKKWFERAAMQNYPPAQIDLGFAYWKGKGVRKNRDTAISWWEKAAKENQKHCYAEHILGLIYWKGKRKKKDREKAADWFENAAQQGIAEAQYYLGRAFEKGKGRIRDYPTAYIWFAVSATRGDKNAQKRRDKVEKKISREEQVEADKTIDIIVKRLEEEKNCL